MSIAAIPQQMPAIDGSTAAASPGSIITITDALARVLDKNPELAVSAEELRALDGRIRQAGLRPNPEISTIVENIAGTGTMGWAHSAETTVQVQMPLEPNSKRRQRVQNAVKEKEQAAKELQVRKAEVLAMTAGAFTDVLACQERLENRRELLSLAEKIDQTVTGRVSAGKVSPIESSRSQVALQTAKLEMLKSDRALLAAKDYLASFWKGSGTEFHVARGSFHLPPTSLVGTAIGDGVPGNLQLGQAETRIEVQKSLAAYELASVKPDLLISAGFRRLSTLGDSALVAGISIPLPFFDRRQGAVTEAQRRVDKARLERTALENRLLASLRQQQQAAESAFLEVATLQEKILPGAQDALAHLEEGYQQGKFDFLSVLDAQRTYAELKGRCVDAVALALKAVIEIQHLNGSIMNPKALDYLILERDSAHEKK